MIWTKILNSNPNPVDGHTHMNECVCWEAQPSDRVRNVTANGFIRALLTHTCARLQHAAILLYSEDVPVCNASGLFLEL